MALALLKSMPPHGLPEDGLQWLWWVVFSKPSCKLRLVQFAPIQHRILPFGKCRSFLEAMRCCVSVDVDVFRASYSALNQVGCTALTCGWSWICQVQTQVLQSRRCHE